MDHIKMRARIVVADDQGPIRRSIDGRKTRPSGFVVVGKGGFRAQPWDSRSCERPAIQLSALSPRVVWLMAQPHRLEMLLPDKPTMKYIPDLMLKVHPSFLRDLLNKMAFSRAAAVSSTDVISMDDAVSVILEIKNDNDPRDNNAEYKKKLKYAKAVYKQMGITFLTIRRKKHLVAKKHLNMARIILVDELTTISKADYAKCIEAFSSKDVLTYQQLAHVLGPKPEGEAKLHALHCQHFVSIDLTAGLRPQNEVRLVEGIR